MAKKIKKNHAKWILTITILAFCISFVLSGISEMVIPNLNIFVGIAVLVIFIFIGVLFDIVGVAITSAIESPFHAKNSKKIKDAKISIKLLKNAARVSSFCNDVIGDICGILSGAAGLAITANLVNYFSLGNFITTRKFDTFN